jgi:hypothetical protein
VHEVLSKSRALWFIARYRLDLSSGGLGNIGLTGRFIVGNTREEMGEVHRQSFFRANQKGSRLHFDILRSNHSNTDDANAEWLNSLGMFIFREKSSLSFKIQPVGSTRYLIDDGVGTFILCTRR